MQETDDHGLVPEFRRPLGLEDLGEDNRSLELAATAEECAALARRYSVLSVEGLRAEAWVRREGNRGARARVQFSADVIQSCVVTLEPVRNQIRDAFELSFLPPEEADARQEEDEAAYDPESLYDPMSDEPPADVVDGNIDLGEVIAEYLSLAIDPYPRKEGVDLGTRNSSAGQSGGGEEGPFTALKQWRGKA